MITDTPSEAKLKHIDEKYMRRAIEVAKNGLGTTAPNPMVGAVIVYDNKIIGEGFTSSFGGAHAEVNAINAVEQPNLLPESTLYVTLEPCSHFGKTPPCANLIVEKKIPRIVIGLMDPHEKVAGKGIELLKKSGCNVSIGILATECRQHHKRFLTFHEKKRPFIILKWAQTSDGFIAPAKDLRNPEPTPYWITNTYSRQLTHKWRSEEQSILVGTNTALEDNPKLNSRLWLGRPPIRIIVDRTGKIPKDFHVFNDHQKTLVLTSTNNYNNGIQNNEIEYIKYTQNDVLDVSKILFEHHIVSVFVEGGAKIIQSFIDKNLWDEARIFTGNVNFHKGVKAPRLHGKIIEERAIVNDQLQILVNDKEYNI